MIFTPQLLLLGSVVAVGVLHTIVPDHWVPIAILARQHRWSRSQTMKAALQAGTGHVVTTLLLASVVWMAGVAFATQFGHAVDIISSLALMGFGLWIAVSSWREMHGHGHHHGHSHEHGHEHSEHEHEHKTSKRTALLLIMGSSPMVEGIPAFFAAGKYGAGLIILMAILFAASTIATYVFLCVYSHQKLHHARFPAFERYGEVLSGSFIALIGLVFFVIG